MSKQVQFDDNVQEHVMSVDKETHKQEVQNPASIGAPMMQPPPQPMQGQPPMQAMYPMQGMPGQMVAPAGMMGGFSWWWILLIIVVVAIVGYFGYKFYLKKKAPEKVKEETI